MTSVAASPRVGIARTLNELIPPDRDTLAELRVGSVGRPLPGTEVAIADDGEILMS